MCARLRMRGAQVGLTERDPGDLRVARRDRVGSLDAQGGLDEAVEPRVVPTTRVEGQRASHRSSVVECDG
jgi:hypothetical protein